MIEQFFKGITPYIQKARQKKTQKYTNPVIEKRRQIERRESSKEQVTRALMRNILIDRLPESVEIDGREYLLDTDFRTCLRIILAFEDPELANIEKRAVMLDNLYMERPENLEEAFYLGMDFS